MKKLFQRCAVILTVIILAIWDCAGHFSYAQITLTSNADITFGRVEFQTNHMGTLSLGTNGGISLTGTGLMYDSGASPGGISITANPAAGVIEVKCSTTAELIGNTGGGLLVMDNIQISANSGVAYGAGNVCQGTTGSSSPALTIDLSLSPSNTIYIGGRLVIPSNELNGVGANSYSSSNTGGKAITLRVLYQ